MGIRTVRWSLIIARSKHICIPAMVLATGISLASPIVLAYIPLPPENGMRVWSHHEPPRWVATVHSTLYSTRIVSTRAWPIEPRSGSLIEGTHPIIAFVTERPTTHMTVLPMWSRVSRRPRLDSEDPSSIESWKTTSRQSADICTDAISEEMIDMIEDARGWPARSLKASFVFDYDRMCWNGDNPVGGISIREYNDVRKDYLAPMAIPTTIIWPGMICNILCGFVFIMSSYVLVVSVIQYNRTARGACEQCGYLLRPGRLTKCPECGLE